MATDPNDPKQLAWVELRRIFEDRALTSLEAFWNAVKAVEKKWKPAGTDATLILNFLNPLTTITTTLTPGLRSGLSVPLERIEAHGTDAAERERVVGLLALLKQ